MHTLLHRCCLDGLRDQTQGFVHSERVFCFSSKSQIPMYFIVHVLGGRGSRISLSLKLAFLSTGIRGIWYHTQLTSVPVTLFTVSFW